MKYLLTLLATVCVYHFAYIPKGVGALYFTAASYYSVAYCLFLWQFARTKATVTIMCIEAFAIAIMFASCLQFNLSLKSQWFYEHYEHIMTVCYLAELIAIMPGVFRDGHTLFCDIRLYIHRCSKSFNHLFSNSRLSLCKSTRTN